MTFPNDAVNSEAIYQRALNVLPGGNTRTTVYMKPFPLYAVRGEGCRVWDADGTIRIDCINNFTSMIHGYSHSAINAAVVEQLGLGTCFGQPTESEIDLAELLVERLPSVEKVRFTNSGTEAVMMALKAARAFTGRPMIAKVEGAYHGSYDYAEVSLDSGPQNWGDEAPVSVAYADGTPQRVLQDVLVIPFNDVEAAERLLREHATEMAAVLIDPLPNRAGLIPASRDFLETLARVCKEIGAVLIFDEVISFRLSYSGAQGLWGINPDLTTLGKIIGGGFPVGAVGGRSDVMAVFDPTQGKPALPHGGTFSANPISMRAGVASMRLLDRAAFEHLDHIGTRVREGINQSLSKRGIAGQSVGLGSLLKVHFTNEPLTDYRSAYASPERARYLDVFNRGLLNRGVLAASYGLMALSTVMNDSDVDQILAAVEGAADDVVAAFGLRASA